jgi:DNA-binding response OmpR family regulator
VSESKKWVLVVDDDEEITKLIGEKLASETMKIQTASRLTEATMKIKNQQYACVVLDFMLDQGTAEHIINAMRADRFGPNYHTPIVLISGKLNPYIVKMLGSQVNGILVKPFDTDALVTKVHALCDHKEPKSSKEPKA